MIVTINLSFDLDDLLDVLDLELVEEEEHEFNIDENGVTWFYEEETDIDYYFDEDLDDWAEVTENGDVWYLDEETDILYYFDDEADDWVDVDVDVEEDDSAAW
jgi:hypothetical protein